MMLCAGLCFRVHLKGQPIKYTILHKMYLKNGGIHAFQNQKFGINKNSGLPKKKNRKIVRPFAGGEEYRLLNGQIQEAPNIFFHPNSFVWNPEDQKNILTPGYF